ncbi:MAG: dynamin family protein [Clostridiales bacterium]
MKNFEDFSYKKERLLTTFRELLKIHSLVKNDRRIDVVDIEVIERISRHIKDDKFVIAVVGVIKRGKSTFLNALLEADPEILPTDATPETARLSYLLYDEDKHAVIHFMDETFKSVSLNELPHYTSAAGKDKKGKEDLLFKTAYAEIHYPNRYLKNNVVIVDTPGIDDPDSKRSEVTEGFISSADAAIFLLDVTQGGLKETEIRFLRNRLINNGSQKGIMVAVNKIGALRSFQLAEVPKLIDDTKAILKKSFRVDVPVYDIDAKFAWEGAKENNDEKTRRSKFQIFAEAMEKMLIDNKGKVILKKRVSEVKHEIVTPIYDFLEYELRASSEELITLKKEIEKLDVELTEQERFINLTKNKYADKLSVLEKEVKKDIGDIMEQVQTSTADGIADIFNSSLMDLRNSVQEKLSKFLRAYGKELGNKNIKIPGMELDIQHTDLSTESFSIEKSETHYGSGVLNGATAFGAFKAGQLLIPIPVIGGIIGVGIAAIFKAVSSSTKTTTRIIDQYKLNKELEEIKLNLIKAYQKELKCKYELFNTHLSSWSARKHKELANRRSIVSEKHNRLGEKEKERKKHLMELLSEVKDINYSLDSILN